MNSSEFSVNKSWVSNILNDSLASLATWNNIGSVGASLVHTIPVLSYDVAMNKPGNELLSRPVLNDCSISVMSSPEMNYTYYISSCLTFTKT